MIKDFCSIRPKNIDELIGFLIVFNNVAPIIFTGLEEFKDIINILKPNYTLYIEKVLAHEELDQLFAEIYPDFYNDGKEHTFLKVDIAGQLLYINGHKCQER